ncbi:MULTISPECIES: DUF4136 domain-containing protein [Sphingobium]|uniref:DUF4136 domain-containing protein n=1 Tax=Sphingobium TaxID=165695 RepID=UPI0015ECC240|nr:MULTISPECIES: DUF4136 domain-containing protein [Sphingobium]MCW2363702.1 hypothetical protein [Sphingobium sp. B10D3B]MCW2371057.1 hypothetical protein [Sphingobium sp. B11D3D]MCW2402900.1 hypothetical protein [Sphingobium sp. B10D7B]MCW2409878.1 hypothetical protein [Sphingobium xanthum]
MNASVPVRFIAALSLLATAAPGVAQWGRGPDRWGGSRIDSPRAPLVSSGRDSREGQVDAAQFTAEGGAARLGSGPVQVSTLTGAVDDVPGTAPFEAAVIDQLVKAGYDTLAQSQGDSGQVTELRIRRETLVPEETKRKPVSGEMMVGTGTYGSTMGMALAVDLSKPRKALVSTRMEARILDKATGAPLWEGRAEIATREGDSRWSDQAIATRLAEAMFERFPNGPARVAAR